MDDIGFGFFLHNFHNSSFDLIPYNTVIVLQDVWLLVESTQLIIFREWWMCALPQETDLIVISLVQQRLNKLFIRHLAASHRETLSPRTSSTLPENHHKTLDQWHILRHGLSQDYFSVDFLHSLSKRVLKIPIPVWCEQL